MAFVASVAFVAFVASVAFVAFGFGGVWLSLLSWLLAVCD